MAAAGLRVAVRCETIPELRSGGSGGGIGGARGASRRHPPPADDAFYSRDGDLADNVPFSRVGASRLGAFEVYMVALGLPEVTPTVWLLHSKLTSRRFPSAASVRMQCERVLAPVFARMEAEERIRHATDEAIEADDVDATLRAYADRLPSEGVAVLQARARLEAMRQADARVREALRTSRHDLPVLRGLLDADRLTEDAFGHERRPCLSASILAEAQEALRRGDAAEAAVRDALATRPIEARQLEAVLSQAAEEGITDGRLVHDTTKRLQAVRHADEVLVAASKAEPREAAVLRAAVERWKPSASPSVAAAAAAALNTIESADDELWQAVRAQPFDAEKLKRCHDRLATFASESALREVAVRLSPSEAADANLQAAMAQAREGSGDAAVLAEAVDRERAHASSGVLNEAVETLYRLRADEALKEASSPPLEASELRLALERHSALASEPLASAARSALKSVELADLDIRRALKRSRMPPPPPLANPAGTKQHSAGDGHGKSPRGEEPAGAAAAAAAAAGTPGSGGEPMSAEDLAAEVDRLRHKASGSVLALAEGRVKQMLKAQEEERRARQREMAARAAEEERRRRSRSEDEEQD